MGEFIDVLRCYLRGRESAITIDVIAQPEKQCAEFARRQSVDLDSIFAFSSRARADDTHDQGLRLVDLCGMVDVTSSIPLADAIARLKRRGYGLSSTGELTVYLRVEKGLHTNQIVRNQGPHVDSTMSEHQVGQLASPPPVQKKQKRQDLGELWQIVGVVWPRCARGVLARSKAESGASHAKSREGVGLTLSHDARQWILRHIRHMLNEAGLSSLKEKLVQNIGKRRARHERLLSLESEGLELSPGDEEFLAAEAAYYERWQANMYGKRWNSGQRGPPSCVLSTSSLSSLVGKENRYARVCCKPISPTTACMT